MAFHTIWSVDLGKSSLKAVKLRRDRMNVEILAVDKIDYPVGKEGVDHASEAREALAIFRAREAVREPVAVVHPGQGTFSRFIKVPAFDPKKVNEMVGYEASQQIPFPLDEVTWDYHIVEKEYLPGEEREVALFAVRREAIDDFLVDFSNEQLSVEMVGIGYLGLLNFVAHDLRPEEPSIVLDIGAEHTDLILIDGPSFWIRPLPHSGADITRSISNRFRLSYDAAERLKIEASKAPKQAVKIFQAVIQPKLKELVGEVHRSIGYYRSQSGEVNFQRLYLLGNGAKIIGIKKFLEEQLSMDVVRVQSIQHFRVNQEVDLKLLQANLPSFASALGLGLQALDGGVCNVDLVPQEDKVRREVGRKKKHAYVASGILLVLMLLASFMIGGKVNRVQPVLQDSQRLLADVEDFDAELTEIMEEEAEGQASGKVILAKMDQLKKVAVTRPFVLKSFQALETVLRSNFANHQATVTVIDDYEKTTNLDARSKEYLAKDLARCLWIPWLRVSETRHDGVQEITDSRSKRAQEGVEAYKFELYAVIRARENQNASNRFIREKLATPLETELKSLKVSDDQKVTVLSDVEVFTGQDGLPMILFDEGGRATSGAGEVTEQFGAPFYGAKVVWFLIPRHPPEPETAEGEEGADE